MKNIFYIFIVFTLFLNSSSKIEKVTPINSKKSISLSKEYLKNINDKINKNWKNLITENGSAEILLIIDTNKGKIEKVIILSKEGDKKFKKEFRNFLFNLKTVYFKGILLKDKVIEIKFKLTNNSKNNNDNYNYISIYKNKSNVMYNEYLTYLQENRNFSKVKLKKILELEKKTVTKMMLMAIFYDYNKDDIKKASEFYKIVIDNKLNRFIKNTEGLFIVDYLTRVGENKLILEILPKFSCQFMKSPKKEQCFYYRARALYNLKDIGYKIELNLAKNKIKQALVLSQKINNIKNKDVSKLIIQENKIKEVKK